MICIKKVLADSLLQFWIDTLISNLPHATKIGLIKLMIIQSSFDNPDACYVARSFPFIWEQAAPLWVKISPQI